MCSHITHQETEIQGGKGTCFYLANHCSYNGGSKSVQLKSLFFYLSSHLGENCTKVDLIIEQTSV